MLKMGEVNRLCVVKKTDFGVYLSEKPGAVEKVLLPRNEYVGENPGIGDALSVFLYRDSEDRPVAALKMPLIFKDKPAALKVKMLSKIGAFLDWGLPKDLFLPFKEMRRKVDEGDEVLVRLYEDKSGRLCASMRNLYPLLSTDSAYQIGDEVEARIYEFGRDFGTFVAVDDKYSGMIAAHEDTRSYKEGDVVHCRVTNIKPDGKLDVSIRGKAYQEMDTDAQKILSLLESYGGVLPFSEKASPEVIKRECGLSKNAFKRAVGRLYKQRKISLEEGKIRRTGE